MMPPTKSPPTPRPFFQAEEDRVLRKAREASAWCLVFLAWTAKASSLSISLVGLFVKMDLLVTSSSLTCFGFVHHNFCEDDSAWIALNRNSFLVSLKCKEWGSEYSRWNREPTFVTRVPSTAWPLRSKQLFAARCSFPTCPIWSLS